MDVDDDELGVPSLEELIRSGNIHLLRHVTRCDRNQKLETLNAALHEAVRRGSEECFRILLQGGAAINALNIHGETLLVTALSVGHKEMVEILFEEGYDVDYLVGNSLDTGQVVPLHLAIMRNQSEMMELLLRQGANSEYCDVDGDTAIISATYAELLDIVQLLVKHGANVNAVGFEGNTALHRAVELNNTELLTCLLDAKPMVDVCNEQGNSALLLASEFGYLECAEVLMNAGAQPGLINNGNQNALHLSVMDGNVNIMKLLLTSDIDIDALDQSKNTAAIMAAFLKHEAACMYLVEKGADICKRGESGCTVIHWAAAHGLTELLTMLIAHPKACIDAPDANGDTPILLASQCAHYECVNLLMKAGAELSTQGSKGLNCLHWGACKGCSDELLKTMLGTMTSINSKDETGATPLLTAAVYRRYALMQELLNRDDCDVNATGLDGRTALHWVSSQGNHDMVWELLKKDALPDVMDINMDTALHLASKGKHTDVVEELLNYGADASLIDFKLRTPLHWACSRNDIDMVNVLLCAAIDLNKLDDKGDAALHLAARNHNDTIVQSLLISGANCNFYDSKSKTALCYMAEHGSLRTVECLLEAGAEVDSEIFRVSPLIQACKKGHLDIVRILLKNKASTDYVDELGRTAFLWAVAKGREEITRCLVEHGTDTRRCDKSADTALTLAAWHGHPNLLSYLIPLSDIEHMETEEGMTALQLAICRDNHECVQVLLEAGASVNSLSRSGNNALVLAATHTTGPVVMTLVLDSGQEMDYNHRGDKDRASIHWSVGDPDAVAVLLERTLTKGLDMDTADANGASPLLLAIAHGQPESARLLIEGGCDTLKEHEDGRQPLHHCALYGDAVTLELLLISGVNPDVLTKEGRTALLLASIEGYIDIVKLLINHNCSVNSLFLNAITPLSVAADRKFYEIMGLLLEAGANPDVIGVERHTPLMTCTFNGDIPGMILLLRANSDVNQNIDSCGNSLVHVAIMKNNTQALLLLLAAGFKENHVRNILNNGIITYFVKTTCGLKALKDVAAAPRCLQQLCRLTIRQCLGFPLRRHLGLLDLPLMMRDYLAMKDIEKVFEGVS